MPLPSVTSVRDRTHEFGTVVERLKKQQGLSGAAGANGAPGPSSSTDPRSQVDHNSGFARKAAEIGHGVHRTSMKLQKLAQLAKRTSMFDDPTAEVEELTGIIKQDITALNAQIAELQRMSVKSKEGNKQSESHSHTVVDSLRSRLKDATLEFKDVLTARSENLQHHKERRNLFSSSADAEAGMPLLHRRPHATPSHEGGSSGHLPGTVDAPPPQPSFLQSASQQQQLSLAAPQDTYLSSRAEALRNVESTIVELGTIFNKLSEMVAEQGELAIRIDENVDDTLSNVSNAQAQLLKYFNSMNSNKWLLMKVFGVLMVFLLLFVLFIV